MSLAVLLPASLIALNSAQAIIQGELDGGGHPYVGLMVAQDEHGKPLWRCSGTLLDPKLFLTAGHCVEEPTTRVEIWFAADVGSGIPANGYPYVGEAGGQPFLHPDYEEDYAWYERDLGVVVLDEPVYLAKYGALPKADTLDKLATRRGEQDRTFTAVGYGYQRINPVFLESELVRMFATPHLILLNDPVLTGSYSMLLSNNHATGGTCFGDSGGPNFIGTSNVIGGVTSFGMNENCAGTGGVYRLDRAHNLDWLFEEFGLQP